MKNDIEYFYNLKINKLDHKNNYYIFEYNFLTFYFILLTRPIEDLPDLYNVTQELINKKILTHEFILNKDGKLVTRIEDNNYVLLKINTSNVEFDLIDIVKFQNSLILNKEKSKLYRNDWATLWSDKIDYFEYQIREIGKDKELILNSFSYYVGLSENAISYVNHVNEMENKDFVLTLAHKRIHYPNYALNFYNPLSFIFDVRVRDVAEYLKNGFFQKENVLNELEHFLNTSRLSPYEYNLLYARLLYPSYYFDLYEKIMNNEEEESSLINIISLVDDYELFLKQAYYQISRYTYLEPIDWIIKKEA